MDDKKRRQIQALKRDEVLELPLVMLKDIVVFPGSTAAIMIGRSRSVAALKHILATGGLLVVALDHTTTAHDQTDGAEDAEAQGYDVAVLASIDSSEEQLEGKYQVVMRGHHRVRVLERTQRDPFGQARVSLLPEWTVEGMGVEPAIRHARDLFDAYSTASKRVPSADLDAALAPIKPGALADLIAPLLTVSAEVKQAILEELDPLARLERVSVHLVAELEIHELEAAIRQKVREQVDKNQREYYLKEQLRAIQDQLGNDQASELRDLRQRLAECRMAPEIAEKVAREIDRLERMPPHSAEVGVLRGYLDWVLALPWSARTEDRLDIKIAQRVLDEDHYGLADIKDRILEFLAVRQLRTRQSAPPVTETGGRRTSRASILCLIGAPGVGKTSLGRSIARALGREFVRISLGGVHDEAEMRGHRRTYIGALPGKIIQAMRTAGTRNPVILLDEIDKLTSDYRGDPASALLEVLDPEQNHTFTDHYIEAPFDLSDVFFVCTGNDRWAIPGALRDRMDIIEVPSYTEEEKVEIGMRHLLPRVRAEHGLREEQLTIGPEVMAFIISRYTREAGVRGLDRQLSRMARKVARKVIETPRSVRPFTEKTVERYLGVAPFASDRVPIRDTVGVVTGMAWTAHGGVLLPVEVLTMPGHNSFIVTGKLGDVMQESARAALSWIRSRSRQLDLPPKFAEELDIHVHLPEGAVSKDGPSAGITMALAMISALTGRKVRHDVAMTGEITLTGRVLAIGGLKEKAMAAHRSGIAKILFPEENKAELKDIIPEVRKKMVAVSTMDDVIRLALLPAPKVKLAPRAQSGPVLVPETPPESPRPLTPLTVVTPALDADLPSALP